MSMATHVVAFRPPDARWVKMKAIWDACIVGGVQAPREVRDFFNGEEPDAQGVKIDIRALLDPWQDNGDEGYELELARLPADVSVLRFYNSW